MNASMMDRTAMPAAARRAGPNFMMSRRYEGGVPGWAPSRSRLLAHFPRGFIPLFDGSTGKRSSVSKHKFHELGGNKSRACRLFYQTPRQDTSMRAWTSCSALLLAILLPAAASAQPVARNGGFYGNTYVAPDYDYPYARTEDGYAE